MALADARWSDDAATPRALGAAQMLDIWETRRDASMTRRALALLGAALPGTDGDALAALPLGARDRLLVRLRAACFGQSMECLNSCPHCDETVEFPLTVADLLAIMGGGTARAGTLERDGREIALRPVTSFDLLSLEGGGPDGMALRLLGRCATGAGDDLADLADLPPQAAASLSAALAGLDPAADVRLSLTCPACGAAWNTAFDIASYLWAEVEMAARRLLPEVHALASSYGWTEDAILALSPGRRRGYLALIGAG